MKFRCWSPEDGEKEEQAEVIEANSVREAAHDYASAWYYANDQFEELHVYVRADDSEDIVSIDVEADPDVSFYAGSPRKVKRDDVPTEVSP